MCEPSSAASPRGHSLASSLLQCCTASGHVGSASNTVVDSTSRSSPVTARLLLGVHVPRSRGPGKTCEHGLCDATVFARLAAGSLNMNEDRLYRLQWSGLIRAGFNDRRLDILPVHAIWQESMLLNACGGSAHVPRVQSTSS
ncbi:hypothetical protein PYCCODRAFT_727802 [Trametes coccinea BRFM310]|uniref:Uncharacterized protein n=1 Tax=Trametes coccinea (strain BRFM310) TaxID=1353009 RepID=A0A1Y2IFQ3_TRAC3|nr:hypothetical protein PYCCODRAFT_727802 [Trametes coccinea BRFM310]